LAVNKVTNERKWAIPKINLEPAGRLLYVSDGQPLDPISLSFVRIADEWTSPSIKCIEMRLRTRLLALSVCIAVLLFFRLPTIWNDAMVKVSEGTGPPADAVSEDSRIEEVQGRGAGLAISTTMLSPAVTFPQWRDYHLQVADLILIFMDDPSRRSEFERYQNGRLVLFNGSLAAPELTLESRLMVRQDENNNAAIAYALQNNITWLMHIDSDEIFYEESYHNWTDLDVGVVHFTNHESVPLNYDPTNPFEECTLFKTNGGVLPFMAYGNGKSAVRITPGVHSSGPHQFAGYEGEEQWLDRPVILHYCTPSFDKWRSKYIQYGNFSDYWWGSPDYPNELRFMLDSRDHVQKALRTGDWEEAREFFNKQIPEPQTIETLLSAGDLKRFYPLLAGNN
jgi:hypothetical protein